MCCMKFQIYVWHYIHYILFRPPFPSSPIYLPWMTLLFSVFVVRAPYVSLASALLASSLPLPKLSLKQDVLNIALYFLGKQSVHTWATELLFVFRFAIESAGYILWWTFYLQSSRPQIYSAVVDTSWGVPATLGYCLSSE